MTRVFHLGDILSVTTGKLLSPRLMDGLYDIENHMTGESLYTHQLGRAMTACRASLIGQHPQLADVDASSVTRDNWCDWLEAQIAKFGKTLPVEPLKPGAYAAMDALDELSTMVPKDRIVVVAAGDGDPR